MKNIILLSLVFFLAACGDNESSSATDIVENSASASGTDNSNLPDIKFEEEEYDFGKMTQGEQVTHSFYFKNTGKKNLIITSASGSCGCTIPNWPKEPIAPDAQGKIDVVFNSEGKRGFQEKTVTIVTNCEPATRIVRIKAEVIVAETAK